MQKSCIPYIPHQPLLLSTTATEDNIELSSQN